MKIRIRRFTLLWFLLIGIVMTGTLKAETHEFILENGLKLIVKEDHRAPVVVSQVWYKVGSSYEFPGVTGISHALEHMMFKGTKHYGPGEFSRIIAANGGDENAFTGSDYTAYFQTLERSRLPISFKLEADRMRNLTLPAEEFAKEIEVVMEERRLRTEDNPQSYTYETLMATAFQTSPYRQPIIGWMQDLERMTVAQLSDWYARYYAPNNAIVVVVGDVSAEQVFALAKQHFGPLPPSELPPADSLTEVQQKGIKRVVVKRPAELPYLMMAYKTPTLQTSQKNENIPAWEPYALDVLNAILTGGKSARLESTLVRGREIAASINMNYRILSRLNSVLTISAVPADGIDVAELEQAIREELAKVKTDPITENELDRVKAQVIAGDIYQKDSIFYQGMILGILETTGLSWRQADDYVPGIKAVTADQVQAVARKYLIDDGLTVAELQPLPQELQSKPSQAAGGTRHVR